MRNKLRRHEGEEGEAMKRISRRSTGAPPEHKGLEGITKKKGKEPAPTPPPPKKLHKITIDVRNSNASNAL